MSVLTRQILSMLLIFISSQFLFAGYPPQDSVGLDDTVKINDTITVIGVGDIMMGTNFPSDKYLHPKGCSVFFSKISNVLTEADITTGNLEGCLSDTAKLVKRCKDTTNCYAFRMPRNYAKCLKDNGFDFLSIANNHSHDFGMEGIQNTTSILDSMNIYYAGTPRYAYSLFEKDGVVFGFTAFSPNKGTSSITEYDKISAIIREMNDTSDVIIVSFHGGAEGKEHTKVTRKTEFYYGEDRGNVYKFARHVVDAGADIVFGHGPHVSRAIEIYNNRLICYSLGNFITYGRFNLDGPNGIAPIVKAYLSEKGEFLSGEIIPVRQYYSGKVVVDPLKRAVNEIIRLTTQDFPDADVTITKQGLIKKRN